MVLCDLGLPGGMTGFDVAAQIRREPELRCTLLVAVSGYGDIRSATRGV
jgi:CheY-like chemotaxis protein